MTMYDYINNEHRTMNFFEHRTMNNINNGHTIVKQWSLNCMHTYNNHITMNDNCMTMNDNCMTMNHKLETLNFF